MTDYISRQKVVDALRANQEICLKSDAYANDSIDNYTLAVIDIDILTVEDLPAAPVREVKRGRWILSRGDSLNFIKCTNCQGLSAEPVAHTVYPWNYCPYCGADMREE